MAAIRDCTSSSVAVIPSRDASASAGLFLDHLLDDPLVDAELFQHALVDVAAKLRPVGLHLALICLTETSDRDFAPFHGRHDVAVTGSVRPQEAGNVENDECKDHDGQAPFEPALVSAHPVEHRHVFGRLFRGWWKRQL